ncbi:hypothetical protein QJS04_geneDACA009147 [Acorus gramineus]|uniref:PsbP C-terminal domain-containing protein n=1 Tax=Acorus gramineus TaxID=55184 RepID=A0AAV9AP24_ACOGR|nr:hypothetical protein QJS04_geneDACA009147 [Acorus gramineus]
MSMLLDVYLSLQNLLPLSPPPPPPSQSPTPTKKNHLQRITNRRTFTTTTTTLSFLLLGSPPFLSASTAEVGEDPKRFTLEGYTDIEQGFTLLRPCLYVKVDKAGATVLFEDEAVRGNNIGVVVSPVRIDSLREFGTPEFVLEKLIQAEKRKIISMRNVRKHLYMLSVKESTKDAEVIGVAERSGKEGTSIYEFEYVIDSTRGGMKRIFSAAFVASKKLYLLNITHSDRSESPLGARTRLMLEQVLHSFDIPTMSMKI